MWILRLTVLLALTGCLDGWEKDPSTEKGLPLAEKVREKDYPAPSPAAFNLTLSRVTEDGGQEEVLGLVQALEGERLQIVAKGQIYDSNVELEDMELMNPELLPQVQVGFDRVRRELSLDWQIPDRFVQVVDQNFQVSPPITIRMRAKYRSVTPEGTNHTEARQIETSFQYIVYRDLFGLEPEIIRVEPSQLEMVENEVLKFELIVDDPGSSQMIQVYDPEVRVVPIVPATNTALADGAHFVRRDKTRPPEILDPSQPTVWKVPMLMDLRGREVTRDFNTYKYGLQAVSKYALNTDISCRSAGECEYREIASNVQEFSTRVYTRLQPVETSMTFSPVVRAGQWNFVQWQLFDPEDAADVNVDSLTCPEGATCSCSRVGRDKFSQCMLEWKPACGAKGPAHIRFYAQSSSRSGPERTSSRRRFDREIRISPEFCNAQGNTP